MTDVRKRWLLEAKDNTRRGTRSARRNFEGLQRGVSGLKAGLAGLGVSLGATFTAAQIKSAIEWGDAIAKQADAVGLGIESLQAYRFAAERSGISTSQLTSNMTAFVKRMGELRNATGPLYLALGKYDAQLVDNLASTNSQEQALNVLADAMLNAKSATDQAYLANAAFGRSGVNMVNMLRNGAQGLSDFQQQAKNAGFVMEESLARKAEVINDKWETLTTTMGVKFKSALITMASSALEAFNIFTDLAGVQERIIEAEKELLNAQIEAENERGRNRGGLKGGAKGRVKELEAELVALREQEAAFIEMRMRLERLKAPSLVPSDEQAEEDRERQAEQDAALFEQREEALREHQERQREAIAGYYAWITEQDQKQAEERARTEKWLADYKKRMMGDLVNQTVALLNELGQKNKAAALAALLVDKGWAIAETFIMTQAAAMRALAELGPIAGPPAAAAIEALGYAKMGLIAATGLAQAAGGGGGGSVAGSVSAGGTLRAAPGSDSTIGASSGEAARTLNLKVEVSGGVIDSEETQLALVDAIRKGLDRGADLGVSFA